MKINSFPFTTSLLIALFFNLSLMNIHADQPVFFHKTLPEGHYKVKLKLGGSADKSVMMVKAESRRLMLENVVTKPGQSVCKTIIVDVRTPRIRENDSVKLKPRERSYLNWDNSLSLEIAGQNPVSEVVSVKKVINLPVIYLAGNSTVTDQEYDPYASWGQMFPNFLKPTVVVANYAESGETLLAFKREKRLEKILSLMKKGDYLLMEFAHNDQKPGGNHLDAFTTYKEELKYYISETRKKGGIPVLVTSTMRRRFDDNGKIINTLEDYPEAMRQLSKEEKVILIDLNALSKTLLEAMGPEKSLKALVHYPANTYPNQLKALEDNTHFSPYGAYELAKCVVSEILKQNLPLKKFVRKDFGIFDPARPDNLVLPGEMNAELIENKSIKGFFWYESSSSNALKPDGN